jgi:hypothetical protein
VAKFATHDASPEQSVPEGVSPPVMYGVPVTPWMNVNRVVVAKTNMTGDINNPIFAKPNPVALITFLLNHDVDYKS